MSLEDQEVSKITIIKIVNAVLEEKEIKGIAFFTKE
jgi:hypothetical protein